ncbi:uncharacterized protein B0T15DRAFT_498275 [Chaetomium strumarium]|uniref:Uncharacterized protein n=1 Tax=Chaetomium strumarium TaxID=1170767 RepID=A0AAJ0H1H3_9PEZI|nr:hypothetical protein B0T15DRAFT_498275 [Chaetomium strumarium]
MIIRSLSTRQATSRPQVHTRKNHDIYNGILHLPLATHVRVEYEDYYHHHHHRHRSITDTTTTTSSRNKPPRHTRYIITLSYAHNRVCEIYRSHDDVVTLRQALLAAGCRAASPSRLPPPPPPPPTTTTTTTTPIQPVARSNSSNSSNNNNRRIDRSRACSCRCTCPVACPVLLLPPPPPPAQRPLRVVDVDTSAAARELQQLLEEGLKRVREGGEVGGGGGGRARVPVEWFLRRRVGDCGGK